MTTLGDSTASMRKTCIPIKLISVLVVQIVQMIRRWDANDTRGVEPYRFEPIGLLAVDEDAQEVDDAHTGFRYFQKIMEKFVQSRSYTCSDYLCSWPDEPGERARHPPRRRRVSHALYTLQPWHGYQFSCVLRYVV